MAISLVDSKTTSATSATPTITAPSSVSGDLLIVIISYNDGTVTVADNNGATPTTEDLEYDIFAGGAGGGGVAIYHRVVGGSEPASYAYTLSTSQRHAVCAFTLRSQHADIFDVAPTAAANRATPGTTVNCDTITTLTDGAWAFAVGSLDSATGTWNTGSPGGSWVELATVNTGQPLKVSYLIKATAGATGTIAITPVASTNIAGLKQFSVKAAVSAVSTAIKDMLGRGFIPSPR